MKKLFTLISLFSGMLTASAQIPFPSANATWTQRHGNGEAPPSYSVIGLKTDDVTIGAYTYHKLYLSTDDAVLEASEYIGGIREDAMGRVYYYNAATISERLLYDFSLVVGDTIYTPDASSPIGVVYNIDIAVIGGVDHRRINFRHINATAPWTLGSWIEGVGNSSLGGLLGSPMLQPTCDCATSIICFRQDGESAIEYHNPYNASIDCDDVFATSAVAHQNVASTAVTVFPNPVTCASHLQVTGNVKYTKLVISDVLGKTIRSVNVEGAGDVALNKADYAPGIYIYQLENGAGAVARGKFVVE